MQVANWVTDEIIQRSGNTVMVSPVYQATAEKICRIAGIREEPSHVARAVCMVAVNVILTKQAYAECFDSAIGCPDPEREQPPSPAPA
jgi:hypothetical protein